MPLKKIGQDQTNPVNNDEDDETKETDKVGDLDDEDCDEDDDDWINDIGLHSNLRSKL
jgi:hypothetical protein